MTMRIYADPLYPDDVLLDTKIPFQAIPVFVLTALNSIPVDTNGKTVQIIIEQNK